MIRLTTDQVNFIVEEVEQEEITFSHLRDDLIDHVCCDIEMQMNAMGIGFAEAYENIRKQLGLKGFRQIQTNTISLIDKNYRIMRNTMKVSGLVSLLLLGFASLFKIMHWPMAGVMLVLGFALLVLIFFPTALYVMNRESKMKGKQLVFLTAFFGGVTFMLGVLFKVMHWPGAGSLLFFGNVVLLFIFIPLLVTKKIAVAENRKEKRAYMLGAVALVVFLSGAFFKMFHWPGAAILIMAGSVFLVTVFLPVYSHMKYSQSKSVQASFIYIVIAFIYFVMFESLLALNLSKSVVDEFMAVEQTETQTRQQLAKLNASKYEQLANLKMKSSIDLQLLKSKTAALYIQIEDLKVEMVSRANHVPEKLAKQMLQNTKSMGEVTNRSAVLFAVINGKAAKLKEALENYRNFLTEVTEESPELLQYVSVILDTELADQHLPFRTWEETYFTQSFLLGTLNRLSTIQRNLKIAELAVLNAQFETDTVSNATALHFNIPREIRISR